MELRININYDQVLTIIRQLPKVDIEKLSFEIQNELLPTKEKKVRNYLQKLLLQAPTWSDEEYKNYLEARRHFNQFNEK